MQIRTPNQGADAYKAKQSLGQNFLVDQNVARRIVGALESPVPRGKNVVEVGPGKGALSAHLLAEYPDMTAIEIDRRSVEYLEEQLPTLKVRPLPPLPPRGERCCGPWRPPKAAPAALPGAGEVHERARHRVGGAGGRGGRGAALGDRQSALLHHLADPLFAYRRRA